ncbi:EamA family transporter [Allokutzneria oryzae]|uniref:EamA family transporter n=1 Tax=Allokutzneria oryzae TaxID=1378989 RepID=A0ABV6A5E0_9PSEU
MFVVRRNTKLATLAGVGLAASTGVLWGGQFAASAEVMKHVDVVHMTLARYSIAAVVLLVALVVVEGRQALSLQGRGGRVLGLGALGYVGFNVLGFAMVGPLPAQSVSVLVATMPMIATAVAWAGGGARPRPALALAALLAFAGVVLVLGKGSPGAALTGAVGAPALLVLLAVAAWTIYTRGAAHFADWSPLRYTALTQVGGVVALMALTVAGEATGLSPTARLSDYGDALLPLLYMALPCAVYGVLAWNAAARRLGPATTSLFITLVPVTALAIAAASGGSTGVAELAGVALVLAALVLGVTGGRLPATPAKKIGL